LRDFTYVDDIVAATILAAERGEPGDVYNVASGNPYPLLDVLEHLGSALGRELTLRFDEAQVGDVRDTWASIERAHRQLGYMPAVALRDGLAAQVAETRRLAPVALGAVRRDDAGS
jgi:UDP-glucuronate 4-epimerase